MSYDVQQDLEDSARRFEMHWPTVSEACGCSSAGLVSVEHPKHSIGKLQILDLSAGIDYLATTRSGGLRSIAARVQQSPHLYSSFTIRERRRTRTPTEWPKRVQAHRNHEMLPDLTVQLYVDKRENLVGYGVVRTRELLDYLLSGPRVSGYTFTEKDIHDGNVMMAVWWLWMRREGVNVKTSGEARLLGPRRPWQWVSMELPCLRCGHQIACHVGGRAGDGWPIYDRIWNDAAGHCSTKGCDCPSAYRPLKNNDRPNDLSLALIRHPDWPLCSTGCGWPVDPAAGTIHPTCHPDGLP